MYYKCLTNETWPLHGTAPPAGRAGSLGPQLGPPGAMHATTAASARLAGPQDRRHQAAAAHHHRDPVILLHSSSPPRLWPDNLALWNVSTQLHSSVLKENWSPRLCWKDLSGIFANLTLKQVVSANNWEACPHVASTDKCFDWQKSFPTKGESNFFKYLVIKYSWTILSAKRKL